MTQALENFTGTTAAHAAEAMGIPLGILNRWLDDVKAFHDAGKFGGYVLMAPDTANIDSINATVSDEVTFEVKSRCTSDDPTNHQGDTCPVHEENNNA